MREHGTRSCYVHGPEPGSRNGGCRCEPCKTANREAVRARAQRTAPAYVAAGPAREHLQFLSDHGVGLKQAARVSGVSHGTISKLMYGAPGRAPSKRIRHSTSERILAVTPADAADGGRIPAGPTWERLDDLIAAGVPKAELARRLGQKGPGLQLSRNLVSARHARAVAAMHAEYLRGEFTYVRRTRHGDQTVTVPAPDRADIADLVERRNQAARRAKYRAGEPVAVTYDDTDQMLVEFVEILEARIDQAAWRAQAACRGRETWVFFPTRGDTKTQDAAKRICASCTVQDECLAAHLNERSGVWGGTTERARRGLRRTAA